jgi:hypothetical protein
VLRCGCGGMIGMVGRWLKFGNVVVNAWNRFCSCVAVGRDP